ncbi:16S rRNA processing protein RimM [bacterium]|nr:16S rRNA processing protein RimM [bacterium]
MDGYFEFGYILRCFGLKGTVVVQSESDHPEAYLDTEVFFVEEDGKALPWFVERIEPNPNGSMRVQFEHLKDEAQARKTLKTCLYLPESRLPALEANTFYYHEIIGFSVWELAEGGELSRIGQIRDVLERSPQDLLEVEGDKTVYLVPLTDDWVVELDRAQNRLILRLPEGLLGLFEEHATP